MTTKADPDTMTPETAGLKAEIEACLPHYYGDRDRQVWWRRRQLWLGGDYPQTVLDAGRGTELLEKARAYYNPDPVENF